MLDNGIITLYFALHTKIKLSLLKTHTRFPKDISHLDHNTKVRDYIRDFKVAKTSKPTCLRPISCLFPHYLDTFWYSEINYTNEES